MNPSKYLYANEYFKWIWLFLENFWTIQNIPMTFPCFCSLHCYTDSARQNHPLRMKGKLVSNFYSFFHSTFLKRFHKGWNLKLSKLKLTVVNWFCSRLRYIYTELHQVQVKTTEYNHTFNIPIQAKKFSGIDDWCLSIMGSEKGGRETNLVILRQIGNRGAPSTDIQFRSCQPIHSFQPTFFPFEGGKLYLHCTELTLNLVCWNPFIQPFDLFLPFKTFNSSNDTIPAENTSLTTLLRTFWQN